jgi:hypothetical protein
VQYKVIDGPHEGLEVHTPGNAPLKALKVPFEDDKFMAIYEINLEGLALAEVEPLGI